MNPKFIEIDQERIKNYRDVRLFIRQEDNSFKLHKLAGKEIEGFENPDTPLYMLIDDRIKYLENKHKAFNKKIISGDFTFEREDLRQDFIELVDESLELPSKENLNEFSNTIDTMVNGVYSQTFAMHTLVDFSIKDYSTAIHSINVMAFTIHFCYKENYPSDKTSTLGLGALLHDTGKIIVSDTILKKKAPLSDNEYEEIKKHPEKGYEILTECDFNESIILSALEHHERLDGSGYPHGKKDISSAGQLIGLIDCYEALISHYRPYKSGLTPYDASEVLLKDVENNKFNRSLFETFIRSRLK